MKTHFEEASDYEIALELAAKAWCAPEAKDIEKDQILVKEFAWILVDSWEKYERNKKIIELEIERMQKVHASELKILKDKSRVELAGQAMQAIIITASIEAIDLSREEISLEAFRQADVMLATMQHEEK